MLDLISLRALAEAVPVGAALLDASGRYLWVNPALAEINQRHSQEHIGRPLEELLPEAVAASARGHLERALVEGDVGSLEGVFVFPDDPNMARTFVQRWFPVPNARGDVRVGLLVWERPEERRFTSELRASQQRLDIVLAAGSMGLWEVDIATMTVRWDRRTAAMFGIPIEEFRGTVEHFAQFVHPDDRGSISAAITRSIEEGVELFRDYRIIRADGELRWVSSRGRVVVDLEGRRALVGAVQDRTDSHVAAERLVRALESMDEAFYRLDADLRFTYVNARAGALLQRQPDDLIGRAVAEAFPPAREAGLVELYERVVATQESETVELYYAPLQVWVEVRAQPDGEGVAVYFSDVTARVERQARERAQAELERAAHDAGARLLDVAARMLAQRTAAAAALASCRAGVEVFGCARVSLWSIDEGRARLVAQHGHEPLPAGEERSLDEFGRMQQAVGSGRPTGFVGGAEPRGAVEEGLAAVPMPAWDDPAATAEIYAPVPLGAKGTLVAVMTFGSGETAHGAAILGVAARFAQQTALALEQARRRQAQAEAERLGAQLQSSLLPSLAEPPVGFEIGSLYQPGERRLLLGGDFSDALVQPDGGIAMIVGDVTGHGPEAAALGAALRAGWRTLALAGADPRVALSVLDDLLRAERDTDEQLVTVCCVRVTPERDRLVVASAGHPPPLLAGRGTAELLDIEPGFLLGLPVARTGWRESEVPLPDRWALLLYTDGLPEAHDVLGDGERLGFEGFRRIVAGLDLLDADDPDAALQGVQAAVTGRSGRPVEDDVALLLLRRR